MNLVFIALVFVAGTIVGWVTSTLIRKAIDETGDPFSGKP